MTSFHKSVSTAKKDQEEKKNTAFAKLEQFLLERRGARQPVDDLQEFERELHSLFATAEAEVVGHEVERFDDYFVMLGDEGAHLFERTTDQRRWGTIRKPG